MSKRSDRDRRRDRDGERKAERQRQADEALSRQAIAEADLHFDEVFRARDAEIDARLAAVAEQRAQLAAELAKARPEATDADERQEQQRDDGRSRHASPAAAPQQASAVNLDNLTLEEYAAIRSRPGMPGAVRRDGLFQ